MFDIQLEAGSNEFVGEWLTRFIGYKMPPLECCTISWSTTGRSITIAHDKEQTPFSGPQGVLEPSIWRNIFWSFTSQGRPWPQDYL
jgi:hypothetical protein